MHLFNWNIMRLIYYIFFVLFSISIASSEYIEPSDVKIKTENYKPENINFENGKYKYKVSWQGIPVATANIEVNNIDDGFSVKAKAKTKNWLSVFYKLKFESESEFDSVKLKPKKFISRQIENSKKKVKDIQFGSDGTISTKSYKNGKEQKVFEFNSGNQTLDPITAAFLARSLPISEGTKKSFDVFNGKHRFLITFNVGLKENIKSNGKDFLCYKVIPEVKKLTDTEGEKRLRSASIWITADEKREVIKIESNVLIGSIKAELEDYSFEKTNQARVYSSL